MSEEKITEPLYYNGYISLDERTEIREHIKELNKKVELQANTLKEKDEMLNNRNGVIEHLNLQNNDLQQRIDKAIGLAYQYAQIDGNHHKMWVIDQMVRELLEKDYNKWVENYEDDGDYSWDTGINP